MKLYIWGSKPVVLIVGAAMARPGSWPNQLTLCMLHLLFWDLVNIHRFNGKKNLDTPKEAAMKIILPLKLLVCQIIAKNRASEIYMSFLDDVINRE